MTTRDMTTHSDAELIAQAFSGPGEERLRRARHPFDTVPCGRRPAGTI
ncbi:hypothetical protein [Actinoplanes sp. DH11]|nr:hypothetical protein [Actinoplanes sp. DH11]